MSKVFDSVVVVAATLALPVFLQAETNKKLVNTHCTGFATSARALPINNSLLASIRSLSTPGASQQTLVREWTEFREADMRDLMMVAVKTGISAIDSRYRQQNLAEDPDEIRKLMIRTLPGGSVSEQLRRTLHEAATYRLAEMLEVGPRLIGVGIRRGNAVVITEHLPGQLWTNKNGLAVRNFTKEQQEKLTKRLAEIKLALNRALINANELIFMVSARGRLTVSNPYAWTLGEADKREQTYEANAQNFQSFLSQLGMP